MSGFMGCNTGEQEARRRADDEYQKRRLAFIAAGNPEWKWWFNENEERRKEKLLPKGMRWLNCDDYWQKGDEYNAFKDEWWPDAEGKKATLKYGYKIDIGVLCYTPRGSVKRKSSFSRWWTRFRYKLSQPLFK